MARLREFDTEEVLDQATDVFWRLGYESASISKVMEATGLQKGSLYQAFGDKHSLFMTVLTRYMERGEAIAREVFESTPPGDAIGVWMQTMQSHSQAVGCDRGCLVWNTTSELAPHDKEVRELLAEHFGRICAMLTDVITRGQKDGSYRTDVSAESLTTFLMSSAVGHIAMQKGEFPVANPEDFPRLVLSTLTG